jgi:iron(II)-dependent oxidoreductase
VKIENAGRYNVDLLTIGHDKEELERLLRRVKGLESAPKEIVESCPCRIATNISGVASKKLKVHIEQIGAKIAIREHIQAPHSSNHSPNHSSKRPREGNGHNVSHSEERMNDNEKRPTSRTEVVPAAHSKKLAPMPVYAKHNFHGNTETTLYRRSPSEHPVSNTVATTTITLKRTVGELTRALHDKDWTVRAHAIIELGRIPSNGIMRHLTEALKDDVWRVRCTALDVLSKAGSDMVLREIAKCVEDDVWHVRYQAVEAFNRIESDKVIKPLTTALNDPNWKVRQRAVQVLGNIRSRRALPNLIACLKDEVWYVRESAAESLAKMKSEKSIKALVGALYDPHWQVRSMAITALREIGSEAAIQGLVGVLSDENWMIHWKAAHALGKIGTTAIFPVLCRLEKENDPFLSEVLRKVLSSLDIVVEPKKQSFPRLEYRSDDPYMNMCYIPAGEFIMGDDNGNDNAKPAHHVFLPEFFIDAYEVTNHQYKKFDPAHEYFEGMDMYPVVNVVWEEAQAYAEWIGKRLPTEAEWEKAARGFDGRYYPWGKEFDSLRCNTEESGNRHLTQVDQYPSGKSPFGVYDLFGNVLEWTADRYKPYSGSHYDNPDFKENFVVLRGSPWIHQGSLSNCATRSYAPAGNKSNFIGFRCVRDIK